MKKEEIYECAECGLHYTDAETAEKCREWCKQNGSCNLEITRHSLERKNRQSGNPGQE